MLSPMTDLVIQKYSLQPWGVLTLKTLICDRVEVLRIRRNNCHITVLQRKYLCYCIILFNRFFTSWLLRLFN
jgi:hypothetical protein